MSEPKKSEATPVGHVKIVFPREFPSDSLLHFVSYLRGAETLTNGELLQHAGIVLGCAGVLLDGSGPNPVGAAASPYGDCKVMSDAEMADALESAMAPQGDAVGAFPWALIIPLVWEMIRRKFGF